ncbi:MAG: DNA polymerase III subunit beta [Candidatus Falkowbacteria bacterium]|nr:DNA polymerase III subunit beta [Candidatus Falkowbacteria bacterium]
MKFVSLQENLKKGLAIVSHVTSRNINLPILNNVLIKTSQNNIELTSTNLEIGIIHQIRGRVEKEGAFTVDAKIINDYVSLLPNDKIKIEEKDGELRVECENYKTKIKGEAAKEFPLIPTIDKKNFFSCEINEFKKALSAVAFAVSTNENRLELSGVLFCFNKNKLFLVATDSYRLAEKEVNIRNSSNSSEEQRVIVPARTIQELIRILGGLGESLVGEQDKQDVRFYLSDNQILFSVDSIDLISRLISGNYPDYKQIIPDNSKTKVLIDRNELLRAVKASAIFSKVGINDVALEFIDSRIIISASSGLSGESRIELAADIKGDNNEIIINYKYLVDGLNNINSDKVKMEIINSNTPCILRPEKENDYLYIVMPIRQ